jgi:hypothetical protein
VIQLFLQVFDAGVVLNRLFAARHLLKSSTILIQISFCEQVQFVKREIVAIKFFKCLANIMGAFDVLSVLLLCDLYVLIVGVVIVNHITS